MRTSRIIIEGCCIVFVFFYYRIVYFAFSFFCLLRQQLVLDMLNSILHICQTLNNIFVILVFYHINKQNLIQNTTSSSLLLLRQAA
mgnify:CR=1 FL=1